MLEFPAKSIFGISAGVNIYYCVLHYTQMLNLSRLSSNTNETVSFNLRIFLCRRARIGSKLPQKGQITNDTNSVKMMSRFDPYGRKWARKKIKNGHFNCGQKCVIAYPHSYLKRVKTFPNSKNPRSYPKKCVGWSLNSGTQFMSTLRHLREDTSCTLVVA